MIDRSLRASPPRLAVPLLLAAWLVACGDSSGTTGTTTGSGGGTTGTTTGTGGTTGSGGATSTTTGAGGMMINPGALVDEGLVARYLIDEADAGQAPLQLEDSAPNPLPIPITYVPEMSFTKDADGRRGLAYYDTNTAGRVAVPVDGTKIGQQIHSSKVATIEIVADIVDIDNPVPYVFIGDYYWGPRLMVSGYKEALFAIEMNDGAGWSDFFVDATGSGRTVYHAVIDTDAAADADRLRAYVDGARLDPLDFKAPTAGLPIDLSIGYDLVLANDAMSALNPQGTLYYVAIYKAAFTDEQVLTNTALLLYDDDVPSL